VKVRGTTSCSQLWSQGGKISLETKHEGADLLLDESVLEPESEAGLRPTPLRMDPDVRVF
jgi:hypothetical protein